jgi:serine phosphatase RsbU (regulator of sigma subunit)
MHGLGIDTMATAVLATIEPPDPGAGADAGWRLTWASAGHLSPLLVGADGSVLVLDTEPELLLGLDTDAPRTDHVRGLSAGDTLLLVTDGLVERRGSDLSADVERLRLVLGPLTGAPVEALADGVLAALVGDGRPADDVALLAVRIEPGTPAPV